MASQDAHGKLKCPECGSSRIERNGHRYLKDGTDIQRYSCKVCAYRFSDPKAPQLRTSKGLKDIYNNTGNR